MPRAVSVLRAGSPRHGDIADVLILDHEQRRSLTGAMRGLKGVDVDIACELGRLRHDDCLVLDDGRLVEIVARPEPLLELRADNTAGLARLAWQIGDRHIPAELHARRVRIRRNPLAEQWLLSLGIKSVAIEAPFEPESGAYAALMSQERDHAHAVHRHGEDCSHSHGHGPLDRSAS